MLVIITGGMGMIGTALSESLIGDGHEVIVLSRKPEARSKIDNPRIRYVRWDGCTAEGWGSLVNGADAIVNLAGDNLSSGRWSAEKKRRIVESRRNAGQAVVQAVGAAAQKPGVVLQASGINYYGVQNTGIVTEESPKGNDFLADVCEIWEASSAPVESMGVRRVVTRSAVVLSRRAGALPRMAMPFHFFVGGPIGRGNQSFSWVHLADVVGVFRFLIENDSASGIYNLAAPGPVKNREFSKTLGKALRRPSVVPVPAIALKLLFGEMSTVLLDGVQAVPERLLETGYQFKYPDIESALRAEYQPGGK